MEGRALSVILTPAVKKPTTGAKPKDEGGEGAEGATVPVGGEPSGEGAAVAEAPPTE
jgi:hypothetical protein